jgi:hypothetical protein
MSPFWIPIAASSEPGRIPNSWTPDVRRAGSARAIARPESAVMTSSGPRSSARAGRRP